MRSGASTGTTTYTTPSDREVVITRVVNAPRRLVFAAWTEPRHLQRWLTGPEGWTMPVCEIDLRPGGRWRYVYRKASGTEMTLTGAVLEVVPPERFVTTESWGPEWPETVNTLVLTEAEGRTTIALTITYVSREARDAALDTGAMDGMNHAFELLDELLDAER
ncbi:MAG TPA: SRPBCC family protein [Gemmatimonadales bacterium]